MTLFYMFLAVVELAFATHDAIHREWPWFVFSLGMAGVFAWWAFAMPRNN